MVSASEEKWSRLQPRTAGLWGLANVIAIEQPGLAARVIDLDPAIENDDATVLFSELATSRNTRIALRGGERSGFSTSKLSSSGRRQTRLSQGNMSPLQAMVARPAGTFDGVELRSKPAKAITIMDEVRRSVAAIPQFPRRIAGVGHVFGREPPVGGGMCRDHRARLGRPSVNSRWGTASSDFHLRALPPEVTVPAAFIAPLPDAIDAKDAAGVPVAFLTAHYGLNRLAQLRRGQRRCSFTRLPGQRRTRRAVQLAQRQGAEDTLQPLAHPKSVNYFTPWVSRM